MPSPFVFGQVLPSNAPYCSRPELEQAILETVENRQRLVLLGERRNGKSTLVERTVGLRKNTLLIAVDLYGLSSVADFVERVRARTDDVLTHQRPLTKNLPPAVLAALKAISSLKIHLPFGVEIGARPALATTITEILGHIGRISEWRDTTVFFDEFHEISDRLPDHSDHVLGVLRGAIQRQNKTAYVFAGSAKDSMANIFTGQNSIFYKTARIVEVGSIPRPEMERFLVQQFARGDMKLDPAAAAALFLLAGESPSDLQELAHNIWARSEPGVVTREQIRDGFSTLMNEVARAGDPLLADATPNQQRALLALALRSTDLDVFTNEFLQFSGFAKKQSLEAALAPFTKGTTAILEKRAGRVLFRERFMRLWLIGRMLRNPGIFPPAQNFTGAWLEQVRPFVAPEVTRLPRGTYDKR